MIPVDIQESSPCFLNFVAEESNEERKMNLDLQQAEVELGVQVQLEAEASPVPGRRPGDAEGPPLSAREQVVPQVDWSFQSDRGPCEWSIQA